MFARNVSVVSIFILIAAFVSVLGCDSARSETYGLFGEPITEEEISANKGKLGRIGWTILYGEIGFFIGLGFDRTIKFIQDHPDPEWKYPGAASIVGAFIGSGWGFYYGNKRARETAIRKINRARWRMRMNDENLDETLRARAMMQEAIELNMGNAYRWGYTVLGWYVGMGTGLVIGHGLKYINVMIPGGALGTLIGIRRGYLKGEENDRRLAEQKAREWLLKQGIQPKNSLNPSTGSYSND
ncbi:MAG: hypothetical protein ACE5PV_10400 [Candidatus Poribacteria bacterium]